MEMVEMENVAVIGPDQNGSEAQADLLLERAGKYIYSIDFSMIINKLVMRHKWLHVEATETCHQYRNYLWLLKKYGTDKALPPSEDIDEFWHQHILDTRRYQADCRVIFGKYLEHYPYYGVDGNTSAADLVASFDKMQELYQQEFGVPLESTRYRFRSLAKLFVK